MKKYLVAAAAAAAAFAAPASALPSFQVTLGSAAVTVPTVNDFKTNLSGLGLLTEAIGASVNVIDGGYIVFELLGSESGYFDTFSFSGIAPYTETSYGVLNYFGAPVALGSTNVGAGLLNGGLDFLFSNGSPSRAAGSGDAGFAVFLPTGVSGAAGSTFNTNVLYFGYDDSAQVDDNHDDLIIRATIMPVPEPATWAMMVGGIAAVGMVMRRRSHTARVAFS